MTINELIIILRRYDGELPVKIVTLKTDKDYSEIVNMYATNTLWIEVR